MDANAEVGLLAKSVGWQRSQLLHMQSRAPDPACSPLRSATSVYPAQANEISSILTLLGSPHP